MGSKLYKVAEKVEEYLSAAATHVGPGAPPQTPMGKKERGKSRPPAGDKAFAFWEANKLARELIEWRVGSLIKHENIAYSEVILELYRNPAIVQAWKAGETQEDRDEYEVFKHMCLLIAQNILDYHPYVQFSVKVNPKPLKGLDEAEDATPLKKPGAKHHRNRRYTVEHTYRQIAAYYRERLEEVGDKGTAEWETAKHHDCSTRKVRMARAFDKGAT